MIYDRMLASDSFDPYVVPTIFDRGFLLDNQLRQKGKGGRNYFLNKGLRIVDACDWETLSAIPLRRFKPDIVIYQQPDGYDSCQSPIVVSNYALTCYLPYYIPAFFSRTQLRDSDFIRQLYLQVLENKAWVQLSRWGASKFRVWPLQLALGSPIREEIEHVCSKEKFGDSIIYAPHWSFNHPLNTLRPISTFLETGRYLLAYAKSHSQYKWVFKPHPVLRDRLVKCGVMTNDEVNEYYHEWERIGQGCYDGDYIQLFNESRAMITDSCSFLTEYALTGRPIIRLVPKNAETDPVPCRGYYETFYVAKSIKQLEELLHTVIECRNDFRKDERMAAIKAAGYCDNLISGKFMSSLTDIIKTGKVA